MNDAVASKKNATLLVIKGQGIGPECIEAAKKFWRLLDCSSLIWKAISAIPMPKIFSRYCKPFAEHLCRTILGSFAGSRG